MRLSRRLVPWVAILTVLTVGLAACGDDEGTTTTTSAAAATTTSEAAATTTTTAETTTTEGVDAGVTEAQAIVDALTGPSEFSFTGPAFDAGAALEGKRIYAIGNGLEYFFVQNWLAGVEEAAAELGMEVTAVDGAVNDPAGLIDQAVAQDYDVILIQSIDSATVAAPLADAKDAGIPTIELTTSDAHLPTADESDRGVYGYVSFCYSCAGEQMADFIVADSEGTGTGVIYTVPGLVVSEAMVTAFEAEMERLCPTCATGVVEAPFAQWGDLQGLTGTAIETYLDDGPLYLVPVFDSMVPIGITAAIAEKGVADQVKIVTYNGSDAGLPGVADGTVAADIGGPQYWLGWATVDQAARALLGLDPAADEMLPHRIFSAANIDGVDLAAAESEWYGGTDFRAAYRELWGLS
jgi:ABC-type sugar transport system substrate-binding protein